MRDTPRAIAEDIVVTYGGSVGLMDAIIDAIMAERKASLEAGYALGFAASGEGWNGEYPLRDIPADSYWMQRRDRDIAAAIRGQGKIESGANAAADSPALVSRSHEEAATEGKCNAV